MPHRILDAETPGQSHKTTATSVSWASVQAEPLFMQIEMLFYRRMTSYQTESALFRLIKANQISFIVIATGCDNEIGWAFSPWCNKKK